MGKPIYDGRGNYIGSTDSDSNQTRMFDKNNNLTAIHKTGVDKTYLNDGSLFGSGNQTLRSLPNKPENKK